MKIKALERHGFRDFVSTPACMMKQVGIFLGLAPDP